MSLPATSQSVTVINNDTLICLPDHMVRRVIADLELSDFRKLEIESFKRDIESLREALKIKEEQLLNKNTTITKYEGIVEEKDKQLKLKDDELATLKKEKAGKYWNGLLTGLGTGAGVVLVLTLL
jgi:hypothetical protein